MEDKIFREKSLDQLEEPDQLTDYLRVTGPGVWLVLAGIIIFFVGLVVWAMFGELYSSVTVPAEVSEGSLNCYLLQEDGKKLGGEVEVYVGDVRMEADADHMKTITMTASDSPALYSTGYLSPGKTAMVLTGSTSLTDGYYNAEVITENIKPITLLFTDN